jgi:hypothetical protein
MSGTMNFVTPSCTSSESKDPKIVLIICDGGLSQTSLDHFLWSVAVLLSLYDSNVKNGGRTKKKRKLRVCILAINHRQSPTPHQVVWRNPQSYMQKWVGRRFHSTRANYSTGE